MLRGRGAEISVIDGLLADCRAGRSGCLLITGEPGIGKTALLEHAAAAAAGLRVVRSTGVESEAHLPFAGLHLLLRGAMDRVDALPAPQARALRGAFGLAPAEPGDRMLVGLAVLSLLAEYADGEPVLCLVDDAQWLDRASTEALLFAARRLDAEGVGLVIAARTDFAAPGLAHLALTGLDAPAAAAVLADHAAALSPADRYRVLAEAQGNPLALLELPAAIAEGGPVAAGAALPMTDAVQAAFLDQARRLPESTLRLLLVAAAEDTGDRAVLLRAAEPLGCLPTDLVPAEAAGLIRVDTHTVRFRHPLVRSAVYRAAPVSLRIVVHTALADALDRPDDADRRAWHRAAVTSGPDERVAAELEDTAQRAATRSGYAAATAAYERAARLSSSAADRARRLVLAAEAAAEEGDVDRMADLAASARPDDPALAVRAIRVRAAAAFHHGSLRTASGLLTEAAALTPDPAEAARVLLDAVHAAWYLGERETAETADLLDALPLPPEDPLTPVAHLLTWAVRSAIGRGDRDPLTRAERVDAARRTGYGGPHDTILVAATSLQVAGQDAEARRVAGALLAQCRENGWIGRTPPVLACLARASVFLGRHPDAADEAGEALRIARELGHRQWIAETSGVLAYLAAVSGDERDCHAFADDALAAPEPDAPPPGLSWAQWALALLDLGNARWESALSRLAALHSGPVRHQLPGARSVPDLVEAAVRLGRPEDARAPLVLLEDWARQAGQPWIDAHVRRCRALLAPEEDAEGLYQAALGLHPDDRQFERARTALLYGEWLRRARRRSEARTQLRAAFEAFRRLGAVPWARRARAELDATGEAVPVAAEGPLAALTPQERTIVRLAARGLSNRDIAAQLFLSPRTVGYHLYKAYPKLGVTARTELGALAESEGLSADSRLDRVR
ncbi:helix-turn-helix transcriptional regulator [Actinokineospora sp. UTMC 2448]|uniref:helix-turn-helix transcriptional regulator n=1 Tax=Actinokineospora sp. UTMC 2448 TaxID=2268449 RepID=UPI002164D53C|nr:helix-turn-helix transcriptional regulator [Actinokineospora sp. UTMC 2448]UVS80408.1 Transcriptional regulatory protein DevR (DosR) [Actinokineospora sp. UTMC 2448]